jgi:hypothetical protein
MTDYEVARRALRTFKIHDNGRLGPVSQGSSDDWIGGVCNARCLPGEFHPAPYKGCGCGVYGALTAYDLIDQWSRFSSLCIMVFAAEGTTIIGPRGLRTQAARLLAYWSPYWGVRRRINKQFPNLVRYKRLQAMLDAYSLPFYPDKEPDDPEGVFWA